MKQRIERLLNVAEDKKFVLGSNDIPFDGGEYDVQGRIFSSRNLRTFVIKEFKELMEVDVNDTYFLDSLYYVLEKSSLQEVIRDYKGHLEPYINNTYDCNHSAVDFYDYMTDVLKNFKQIQGSGVAVSVLGYYYQFGMSMKGHALNYIPVLIDGEVRSLILEPQTNELYGMKTYFNGKDYNNLQLGFLFM